jgi:hypothetical protein
MTRSKKVFFAFVVVFFGSLVFLVYDISRKTTFPGSKARMKVAPAADSAVSLDSAKSNLSPKTPVHQP